MRRIGRQRLHRLELFRCAIADHIGLDDHGDSPGTAKGHAYPGADGGLETIADLERLPGEGVRVVIGQESDLTSELNFSLVATSYGFGDQTLGTMGIFGPSRMDYAAVIPLVNYLGDRLSQALERTMS